MAFWAQGSAVAGSSRPSAGPAQPLSYVLGTGSASLTEYSTLVRLRVDVPSAAAALAAAAEDVDDDATAAELAEDAACALGQLHEVIRGIEQSSDEARAAAVLELMQDKSLQLLCSKAVVAKVYKSLLPHQASVGFSMAPAKACLSQKPVAAWDLEESLQTAVIKTLTGCSSGTASCTSTDTTHATAGTASGGNQGWMCLSRRKVVGANMLTAPPGEVSTAAFVEQEVKYDAGNKGLLLIVHAAGSLKFRLFSPCQALQQDPKSLKAPLTLQDTDAGLLADPSKLAAAARQLEGRAAKLLPDERLVFIKGLSAAPTESQQLQRITQYWLGCFGLLLPPSFPFLVGVATHPEAETAQMQVPSCCVLTNLGMSILPGSQAGGSCHTAAVSRLASDLQAAAAGYSFWGNKLTLQLKNSSHAGTVLSQANVQLTQASQPPGPEAAAAQLKAYSLQTQWTSATELSKLQAQASKQPQQQQQRELTAAEAQLMGLVEADGVLDGSGAGFDSGSSRQQGQRGAGSNSSTDKERWAGLKAYLAEKETQKKQSSAVGAGGIAAPAAAGSLFASARTLAPGNKAVSAAGVAPGGAVRSTGAAAGGAPAAPRFGSRKPGASKPPAAASKPSAAAGGKKPGVGPRLLAALQAAQSGAGAAASEGAAVAAAEAGGAAAAAVRSAGPAVAAKAPALGKRPGGTDAAAAKPPAPKKTKAAAGAGGAAAGAKPKAPKKPKAATAGVAAAAPAAAGAGAATAEAGTAAAAAGGSEGGGSQQPAAAAAAEQQQQRKRTKAADLDLAAVSAKVQAAFAASAGAALKGVSVPEMQCYLRSQGVKGGSAKRADVKARLLALLATAQPGTGS